MTIQCSLEFRHTNSGCILLIVYGDDLVITRRDLGHRGHRCTLVMSSRKVSDKRLGYFEVFSWDQSDSVQ